MIQPFSWASYLTAGTTFLLVLFIFFRNRTSRLSKIFILYSLSISEWSFFTALHAATDSQTISFVAARAMHVGVAGIPILFFHFSLNVLNLFEKNRAKLTVGYGLCAIFIAANFMSDLIVPRVVPKLGYSYFMDGGLLYPALITYFVAYIALGLNHLFRAYQSAAGNRRNQLKYLFWGSVLGYMFGPSCFLPVYNITVFPYPYGSFAIVVYVMLTAYAIFRYRLMDIRVMAIRAGVFSAVYLPVLAIPFVLGAAYKPVLVGVFGDSWWVVPVLLENVLALFGIYIYLRLKSGAENALLREQRRYQTSLLQISQSMTLVKELDRLLGLIVRVVSKAVRVKNVMLFLKDKDSPCYALRSARYRSAAALNVVLDPENMVVLHLMKKRAPIVLDEILVRLSERPGNDDEEDLRQLELKMKELGAAVVVPSFIHEVLIGFMVLGEKNSGYMYTQDDLNVFSVLANQSALAIENAIFYEERGKSLAEQFHDEKLKSLGRMGSDMSHQVNNRLNIIMSAVSSCAYIILPMLKEELKGEVAKNGAGKYLGNIEEKLKTIEDNAKRGGEIAQTIMRFAKKTAEIKLEPMDFALALKGARVLLSVRHEKDSAEILTDVPDDTPKIQSNLALLEEILMNLFSNARDAHASREEQMKEGNLPPEPGYKPKISIRAYTQPKSAALHIDIEDNGIGMTKELLDQIFIPFFSTKAGTGKGTGIGMSIIRQMVEHLKGKIEAKSVYGQGTVFTLSLPLAEETATKK